MKENSFRINYEKQASKDAKKQNSLIENIRGKGLSKEEVISVDEDNDLSTINKITERRSRIMKRHANVLDEAFGYDESTKAIARSMQEAQIRADEDYVDKVINSKLTVNFIRPSRYHDLKAIVLEGVIKGKSVKVKAKTSGDLNFKEGDWASSGRIKSVFGTVDGKPVSEAIAREILREYFDVAYDRTERLIKVKEEKRKAEQKSAEVKQGRKEHAKWESQEKARDIKKENERKTLEEEKGKYPEIFGKG